MSDEKWEMRSTRGDGDLWIDVSPQFGDAVNSVCRAPLGTSATNGGAAPLTDLRVVLQG